MRLDSRSGLRGQLIDLATGQPIRWPIWWDADLGSCECFTADPATTRPPRERAIRFGRFRFEPGRPAGQATVAVQPVASRRISARKLAEWLLESHWCEAYGCHRRAEWETADEEQLPPVEQAITVPALVAANGRVLVPGKQVVKRYERGRVVRNHLWCSHCYRSPGIIYPDGSVEQQELQGVMGRPQ